MQEHYSSLPHMSFPRSFTHAQPCCLHLLSLGAAAAGQTGTHWEYCTMVEQPIQGP